MNLFFIPFDIILLWLSQTWVYSSTSNKAKLLTLGCVEGKCNIYCRSQTSSMGLLRLKKPELPDWFQGTVFFFFFFKGKVREGRDSICDQFMHNSTIVCWWANNLGPQGLSTLRFQSVVGLQCSQSSCSYLLSFSGGFTKSVQEYASGSIIHVFQEGTKDCVTAIWVIYCLNIYRFSWSNYIITTTCSHLRTCGH